MLVKRITEETSPGGIILPEQGFDDDPHFGKVVGSGSKTNDIRMNHTIVYGYVTARVEIGGEEYEIVHEKNVYLVL